jgi:hypothetical protein
MTDFHHSSAPCRHVLPPHRLPVDAIQRAMDGSLDVHDVGGRVVQADEMVVATGLRPDLSYCAKSSSTSTQPSTAQACWRHSSTLICTPAGPSGQTARSNSSSRMVSYGRAPTFLLATGYEQVRSIAAFIAGDMKAARRVELNLPQTGVCSSSRVLPSDGLAEAACCTPETSQVVCCAPKPALAAGAPCCGSSARGGAVLVEPAA